MERDTFDNREYRPWQSDGIEFLNGDWEIWRAENEGTYYYSFGGTMCNNAVDAMSLIDWHMAKLLDYEEFEPWTTNISFKSGDWEIMRDIFARGGANKYKKYYVWTSSGIKKVNMYGLLALDMATCDETTEQEILRVGADSVVGDVSHRPWPSDGIVFTPHDGVDITRAASEGLYIYQKGFFRKTVKAGDLLESGNAAPLRPIGLAKLSFSLDLTKEEFAAEFGNFWLHDAPLSVDSFREVVLRWRELCTEGSALRLAVIDGYKQIAAPLANMKSEWLDIMKVVCDLYAKVKVCDEYINCLVKLRDMAALENIKKIGGDVESKIAEIEPKLTTLKSLIDTNFAERASKMRKEADKFGTIKIGKLCPTSVLPLDLRNEIKSAMHVDADISAYSDILSQLNGAEPGFMSDIEAAVTEGINSDGSSAPDKIKRRLDKAVQKAESYFESSKANLDALVDEVYKYMRGAQAIVRPLMARATMLDKYIPLLGKNSRKRTSKYYTLQPDPEDSICFTTNIEIIPPTHDCRYYRAPLKDGRYMYLTVPELIYMGLAEYVV